ncbi:MAG: helix-turn-helix domain-containing protein [Deltaproteobacteria bacterium]|nr:MAG: helix-turn-helix domain-containing protein [Deltaproteobacteria bacterium]TMG67734.1 MAG: helix-turn-helix domain-containing protein [Chloroflexota bacterium]
MRSSEIAAEPLWTVREAAAFVRLGRNTVYEWAASGKLPSLRLGSRIRFLPAALRRWLAVQVDLTRRP